MSDDTRKKASEAALGLEHAPMDGCKLLSLFKNYPKLAEQLPHVSLGQFPTPVEKLTEIGSSIGVDGLYIKRDDLSGIIYGGNKVRKLEFLLADALRARAREVVTIGFAGSNHALATAIYAHLLGLKGTSLLMPQVNAHYLRRNLLAGHFHQAELRYCANLPLLGLVLLLKLLRGRLKFGVVPKIIPAGGSCPLGVLGYVNAALELNEQIVAGELPKPDLIYVPMGSMGTAAGLMLGLKAVGLQSQVVPVRVIEPRFANAAKMLHLFEGTVSLLRKLDPTFPNLQIDKTDLNIRDDCFGPGYAHFTEQAMKAAEFMKAKAGIVLNGSYSAKAFAAILEDARRKILNGKTILFWNTYNSRDLSSMVSQVDYHQLPKKFHPYFERDVQLLDQAGLDR